jgi:hypothetical protein
MVEGRPPADSPPDEDPEIWKRELLSLSERIVQATERLPSEGVIFCKHMAKHSDFYDFEKEFKMEEVELLHRHVLLIRDPVDVLSSWSMAGGVHGDNPTSDEVGIIPLMVIYSKLESRMDGMPPVLVDSNDLVSDPEGSLYWMCERLSVPFHQSMLTWESGKHKCDGPWARVSSGSMLLDAANSFFWWQCLESHFVSSLTILSGGTPMSINLLDGKLPLKNITQPPRNIVPWIHY